MPWGWLRNSTESAEVHRWPSRTDPGSPRRRRLGTFGSPRDLPFPEYRHGDTKLLTAPLDRPSLFTLTSRHKLLRRQRASAVSKVERPIACPNKPLSSVLSPHCGERRS